MSNLFSKDTVFTLNEKVNFELLDRIISSEDIDDITVQLLNKYKKKRVGNVIKVNYVYSRDLKQKGRLYAVGGIGLQSIKKSIRHVLCKDIYYDIDMVNAHPSFLLQYCDKNDINCQYLREYVEERDQILKKVQKFHDLSRDEAKKIILRMCYLGNYVIERYDEENEIYEEEEPEKKMKWLVNFGKEMKSTAIEIASFEEKIFNEVKKVSDKKNKYSSTMSIVAQVIENKCLMEMKKYFERKKIVVGVLCFDGLMVEKNKINKKMLQKFLLECEKNVLLETNYKVKLLIKEMDEEFDFKTPEISNFVHSDKEAQEKIFQIEGKDKFKFCKGDLYVFNENTGMYETDIETLFYYLIKNSRYLNKEVGKVVKNYGTDEALMKKVIPFVKTEAKDDSWLEKTSNSSLGYLLFKDGIYNMKTGEFTKGFNSKIVFHTSIPWNFPKRNEEEIKMARGISFDKFFDNSEPMIVSLARALAGDIEIKKFYMCPGKSNAGKSMLGKMLKTAFGGYVGTFNAESLAHSSINDNKDEGAKMRWSFLQRYTRILMSNEVNMKKGLDGNSIKKHASGGDTLQGRTHGKEEVNYIPHYTIFCMLNDIPKIEPMDDGVINRLTYIEFPFIFVSKDKVALRTNHKPCDLKIEQKINENKFIRGFIHILLDGYQKFLEEGMPEYDEDVKNKWTSDGKQNTEVIDFFTENYEITNNDKDFISVQEMKKIKSLNKELFSTISINRFNEILRDDLKLREGRNAKCRFWSGIKKKDKDFY